LGSANVPAFAGPAVTEGFAHEVEGSMARLEEQATFLLDSNSDLYRFMALPSTTVLQATELSAASQLAIGTLAAILATLVGKNIYQIFPAL
jgi:hypothetical protein